MIFNKLLHILLPPTDFDGPHGAVLPICMVSTQSWYHSLFLVWYSIQSYVSTMGVSGLQYDHQRIVSILGDLDLMWSRGISPMLGKTGLILIKSDKERIFKYCLEALWYLENYFSNFSVMIYKSTYCNIESKEICDSREQCYWLGTHLDISGICSH